MTNLSVTATHDFSADVLTNITSITFDSPIRTTTTATFVNTQFDDVKIKDDVTLINATTGPNSIVVNGGSLDASGWLFTGWNSLADTIVINGGIGADTILGSSQADTIAGGGG